MTIALFFNDRRNANWELFNNEGIREIEYHSESDILIFTNIPLMSIWEFGYSRILKIGHMSIREYSKYPI